MSYQASQNSQNDPLSTQSTPTGTQQNPTLIELEDGPHIPSSFDKRRVKPRKPRGKAVDWSPEMTTVLLRGLVSAIRAGKRSDNGFKIEVWNTVADEVRKIAGEEVPLSGEKCQTKLESLKKKRKVWIRLREMSGFGVDPISGAITAPDDVWDIEIQRQPTIREFRDRPIGNIAELEEIFEGVQARGHHAIYPGMSRPQATPPDNANHNSPSADSDDPFSAYPAGSAKRKRPADQAPVSPLGHVRQKLETPATRIVSAIEKLIATSITVPVVASVIQRAITKFRENYKGKPGWSTQDILAGYKLFESSIKADIFVALDGGEDEEMWLKDQIATQLP